MNESKVTVVDFGVGNLFSIERAVRHVGGQARITNDPAEVAAADRLILPGVGAFGGGMDELEKRGLASAVCVFVQTGKPLLGICLGMQLLLGTSYEFGERNGLGLIDGNVVKFKDPTAGGPRFKVPQIGWNSVDTSLVNGSSCNKPLLEGIDQGSFFYFVHSYICCPDDPACVVAESVYGEDSFCAVIRKDNIWGCQFHPERSGPKGLLVYRNFMNM